nr:hypothetical protein GCM10025732_17730 [Glycomyces mayteni]
MVAREYEVGMQDQAPLGPESGVAVPTEDGLVLHVATQWLHSDLEQIAPCLGLPPERLHLAMAGIGGAFGAREDLSVQVHMAMLALRTKRPVKMMYDRAESFLGHVHRHPARMRYEHGADAEGRLVYVKAHIVLDGGAYASTSEAVVGNAASLAVGPYKVEHVSVDAWGARTNNPPCGAMRGFGGVQTCFAYESQMDAIADALGLDPLEVRRRNALAQGDKLVNGQVVDAYDPARAVDGQPFSPLRDLLDRFADIPVPPVPPGATSSNSPAGPATPPTAKACAAASATASASRTSATPKASTTTRPRASASNSAGPSTTANPSPTSTRPQPKSGRATGTSRPRSPAPNSGSNGSCCCPTTPRPGPPGPPPRPASRT